MKEMPITNGKAEIDRSLDNGHGMNFKAIRTAEILFHDRTEPGGLDLADYESYRCRSKRWGDETSELLIGAKSCSNGAWQSDLFSRVKTPDVLAVLGAENRRPEGVVEAHIYRRIRATHMAIAKVVAGLERPCKTAFSLAQLLHCCRQDPALRRVTERAFEIVAYAVLDVFVEGLGVIVSVRVPPERLALLDHDDQFIVKVLGAARSQLPLRRAGHMARVGLINAADGGLDLCSNFGFGAQVKHAIVGAAQARSFLCRPSSSAQALICRSAVIGRDDDATARAAATRVISEVDLIGWSDLIAGGRFGPIAARALRTRIAAELRREFPGCQPTRFAEFMRSRGYDKLPEWKVRAAS
jgi:hypothetical protein